MYASENWVNIGSVNGLSPVRRQAITWTNAGLLSIGPLRTNFSEIWIKIKQEQLERLRSEDTPRCLMITYIIESYWIPSKKNNRSRTENVTERTRFSKSRSREREIKFIGLFEDRGHRGPYSPFNNNLYIGIIIFPHIDNPQSTSYNWPKKKTIRIINERSEGPINLTNHWRKRLWISLHVYLKRLN